MGVPTPKKPAKNGAAAGICSAEVRTVVTGKRRLATEEAGPIALAKGIDGKGLRNKRVRRSALTLDAAPPICSAFQADLSDDDPWAFIFGHEGMGRSDRHDWKEHKAAVEASVHDDLEENEAELGMSWRRGLAELRKSRPPAGTGERMTGMEDATGILKALRRAVRKDSWEGVLGPRVLLSLKDMTPALKHLQAHECEAVLQACALRYTLYPMERRLCGLWIQQLLEVRGAELVGEHRVQAALRPLRVFLAKSYGGAASVDRSTAAVVCCGKWRLALALRTDGPAAGDTRESGDEGDDKE